MTKHMAMASSLVALGSDDTLENLDGVPSYLTPVRFNYYSGGRSGELLQRCARSFVYYQMPPSRVPPDTSNDPRDLRWTFDTMPHDLRYFVGPNTVSVRDSVPIICFRDGNLCCILRNRLGEYIIYSPEIGLVERFDDPSSLDDILDAYFDPSDDDPLDVTPYQVQSEVNRWPPVPPFLSRVQVSVVLNGNPCWPFFYYEVPVSMVPYGWSNDPFDLVKVAKSQLPYVTCQDGYETVRLKNAVPIICRPSLRVYLLVNSKGEFLFCNNTIVWRIDSPTYLESIFDMLACARQSECSVPKRSFTELDFTKFLSIGAENYQQTSKTTAARVYPFLDHRRLLHPLPWDEEWSLSCYAIFRNRVPLRWSNASSELIKFAQGPLGSLLWEETPDALRPLRSATVILRSDATWIEYLVQNARREHFICRESRRQIFRIDQPKSIDAILKALHYSAFSSGSGHIKKGDITRMQIWSD